MSVRHARELGELFRRDPSGGAYEPSRLLVGDVGDVGEGAREPLETQAAWALWESLIDAAIRSTQQQPELAARVRIARLLTLQDACGYDVEADAREARALAHQAAEPDLRVEVELGIGVAMGRLGRVQDAERALRSAEELAEGEVLGKVHLAWGAVHWRRGRFAQALASYETATSLIRDHEVLRLIRHNQGLVRGLGGELEEALQIAEQVLHEHRTAGRPNHEAHALNSMGIALQNWGCLDEADDRFQQAEAIVARLGGARSRDAIQVNRGLVDHERGDLDDAITRFVGIVRRSRDNGNTRRLAIASANLGVSQRAAGSVAASVTSLEEAVAVARALSLDHLAGFAGSHLALSLAEDTRAHEAVLGDAHDALERAGDVRMLALWQVLQTACKVCAGRGTAHEVRGRLDDAGTETGRSLPVRIACAELSRVARRHGLC